MHRSRATLGALLLLTASWAAAQPAASPDPGEESGFIGLLISLESLDLAPPFEGRLEQVRVRIGASVVAGELLATLDDVAIRQGLAGAQADLEEARAARSKAESEASMARELFERRSGAEGVFSAEDLRAAEERLALARISLEMSDAGIRSSEATVRRLGDRLNQTRLTAPFDGTVAVRYLEPGMIAGPRQPVLRLIGSGGLWVRFAVPLSEMDRLTVGGSVSVLAPSLELAFPGTIRNISTEVDAASGMIFCEATIKTPRPWTGPALAGREAQVLISPPGP